jgi:hypothetical protein
MKQIKVDSCRHCPLRYGKECSHQSVENMFINNLDIIEPNCPLEDLKEG